MTREERSHLLVAAARAAEAAAHAILVPAMAETSTVANLITYAREILAFADEMGK